MGLRCGPDFDRPSVVDSLRILAVRADPAAILPGESTTLTPLVADPLGAGRTVTHIWGACVTFGESGVAFQLPSDCAADRAPLPPPGTVSADGAQVTVAIPPRCDETMQKPCLPADLDEIEGLTGQSGTFGIPIRLAVTAGDEEQIAIVPVAVVLDDSPPNRNPAFDALAEGGAAWPEGESRTVREDPALTLRATWPADDAEPYTYVASGSKEVVETREVIAVHWYASLGRLDPDVTSDGFLDANLALDPEKPSPDGADGRLWVVISDGRGGVAWAERPLALP